MIFNIVWRIGLVALVPRPVISTVYDWPDVLGRTWMFDQGSTHGYMPVMIPNGKGYALHGPAPDWALGSPEIPTIQFDSSIVENGHMEAEVVDSPVAPHEPSRRAGARFDLDAQGHVSPSGTALEAAQYPGTIKLDGMLRQFFNISAQLVFASSNTSLIMLRLQNLHATNLATANFHISGVAVNISSPGMHAVKFGLPAASDDTPCLATTAFRRGNLRLTDYVQVDKAERKLKWSVTLDSAHNSFSASSSQVAIPAGGEATTFITISSVAGSKSFAAGLLKQGGAAGKAFENAIRRWDKYLSAVLLRADTDAHDLETRWVAVKSVQTLMYNWRFVPGLPDGVLPSYTGYQNGFWSWDTYKQAVGMVAFAPDLAKQQLRLLVTTQDPQTGHLPDKVDRCGRGGGCSGKPPLLSWSVWEIYQQTRDTAFLREMRPVVEAFHAFWYSHRDNLGVGLCSWTEGMESGMDDAVRFMPQYAAGRTNTSSHVTTLDFWSVDLNAYLYREKKVLASMADALGDPHGSAFWTAEAKALLLRLQSTFFESGRLPHTGFFQDRYFNGSVVPVQGCEGYAALFAELATTSQALAAAAALGDPGRFLGNFSLRTVSKQNKNYNERGYWTGPTWLDQSWFAYTGLRTYSARQGAESLGDLAQQIKRRVFNVGVGFRAPDTTPLNEHYDAETGEPLGATHFSWTAAHTLMWLLDNHDAQQTLMF